jgi:endonuclease YncB( thermonuclease family)
MRWPTCVLVFVLVHSAHAETLSGSVVTVIDGDTLTVADAAKKPHRVRLIGIDAPEAKQAFYVRSARSLAQLCHGKPARVEWQVKERDLLLGQVACDGKDASAEQVRRGMAWVPPRQAVMPGSALYELEAYARLRKTGLWADENAVPPWEWRSTGLGKGTK